MKTFRLFLWVIAALLAFSACSDDDDEVLPEVYKVSVTTDNNGTAVADPAEAAAGVKITLKATANEGYVFAGWTVEGGSVMLASATAAETSFTMPKGDVSIKAAFVAGKTEQPEIEDILPFIEDEVFKSFCKKCMVKATMDDDGNLYPKWDTDEDGKLSSKEAAAVTWMNMSNEGEELDGYLASLAGIEYFTNLEYLNVDMNDLTALNLTHNKALVEVHANSNLIEEIDITMLSELKKLMLFNNAITLIDLTKCPKLETLDISVNLIESLDLSKNPELIDFNANGYQGNGQLETIDFSNNPKLIYIRLSSHKLRTIDVSMCPDLKVLALGKNQLTELNVTQNTKLTNLQFPDNKISEIDLSNNPDLNQLYAFKNELTRLDVTNCSKLVYCQVFGNRLTEFDATTLAFYYDTDKDVQTNAYDLWCGCQRKAGVSIDDYTKVEMKAGSHEDMFDVVKIKLRKDMKEFWDSNLEPGTNVRNNWCTLEYVD